jgi:hypothetical protein
MNTPPTIQGKELRPLNHFIWARLCEFLPDEKRRGKTHSTVLIYGYAALAMSDQVEVRKAMRSDDDFFDAMANIGLLLSEEDENEIGLYVQGVIHRWEAAQVDTAGEGKQPTEEIHQVTEPSSSI